MHTWAVGLAVSGPIKLSRPKIVLRTLKGDYLPFETSVILKSDTNGIHVTVDVLSHSATGANDAAVYFIGRAIDILGLETGLPLHVSTTGSQFRRSEDHVKFIVDEDHWLNCFEQGRLLGANRSTFSRALSWFRKGSTAEDPIDKLLACWASIEIIGARFARDNERTRRGTVNKICDCFEQLWGPATSWPIIRNDPQWLNSCNTLRNNIAHGVVPLVDLSSIREISQTVPKLHELALEFLRSWRSFAKAEETHLNSQLAESVLEQ